MVKVLILASVSPMIESFNQENIQLLQNNGLEVHVMANFHEKDKDLYEKNMAFKDKLELKNIKVYDLPIQREPLAPANLKAYRQIKKTLNDERYALVHCHTPVGGVLGRLASRGTKKSGTKVIYTAHGFHFFKGAPKKNWVIYYVIEKILSLLTDCLITINPEDYTIAKSKHFKMKDLEIIKGVGINLDKFCPTDNLKRKSLRKRYGYSEEDILLIYVGELSKRKNQAQAIYMMRDLVKKLPRVKLLLVGDGPYHNEYTEMIQEFNLTDNVFLLGYRTDIPELMSLSDICISTSRQEGLPVNVMEAMATGLPLVVTDCRGNRDLIHDGINGYVVQIDDHEQMTSRVSKLIENEELRKAFGSRNAAFITPYEIRNVNPQMNSIYKKHLKPKLLTDSLLNKPQA